MDAAGPAEASSPEEATAEEMAIAALESASTSLTGISFSLFNTSHRTVLHARIFNLPGTGIAHLFATFGRFVFSRSVVVALRFFGGLTHDDGC